MQWIKNWRRRPAPTETGSRTSSCRASFKPGVEPLDQRYLPSTCGPISSITGWSGATHAYEIIGQTVYRTDYDGAVLLHATHSLGGPSVLKVSAALDAQGNPEVFAIATDYTVWLNDSTGWHSEYEPTFLGLNGILELSGTVSNYAYARDGNNRIWGLDPTINTTFRWLETGFSATHIAASDREYVYGIDPQSQQVFKLDSGYIVTHLGGPQVIQISTAAGGDIWAIDTNHNLRRWTVMPFWPYVPYWENDGGYCIEMSANAAVVYAVGSNGALYKYDPHGTYEPTGWTGYGGVEVADISAPDGIYYTDSQHAGVDECYGVHWSERKIGNWWLPVPTYFHHTWWGWQDL